MFQVTTYVTWMSRAMCCAGLLVTSTLMAAPPANDECAGATPVFDGVNAYSTIEATTSLPATSCIASKNDVWYTYTATATGTLVVTNCPSDPAGAGASNSVAGFDSVISVYSGTCGALTQIGCADGGGACGVAEAKATAPVVNGNTYFIRIGVWGSETAPDDVSTGTFVISTVLPPANDTCGGAIALALDTPVSANLATAAHDYTTPTTNPPFSGIGHTTSSGPGRDLVYSFTAPSAGKYSFRVQGPPTGGLSNLLLYIGNCPGGSGVQAVAALAAANRNSTTSSWASEEIMCFPMSAAQQVYVYVDEVALTAGTTFTLEVNACEQETEANGTPGTANAYVYGIEGSITPAADADFFSLGSPAAGSRVFALADGISGSSNDFDLRVTTTTDTLEYDDGGNDTPFGSLAPECMGTPLTGVASFLRMSHFSSSTQSEPYRLFAVVQPPMGSATPEPAASNDTPATASSGSTYWSGALSGTTDADHYAFTAQAGQLIFLGLDADPLRNATPFNSTLALLNSAGTAILSVNDGGSASSTASGAGNLAATVPNSPGEGIVYRVVTSGTFYARVGWSAGTAGDYLLSISVLPVLGNDADGDGVPDDTDLCPDTPEGEAANAEGCACSQVALCDDGDACTIDTCSAGTCAYTPINCDDGDLCTIDTCESGFCIHTPKDCDDGDVCTIDDCVNMPASGGNCCVAHPGTGCTDPACQAAVCAADPFCCSTAWDSVCASGAISLCGGCPTAAGVCTHTPVNCDDGDACTVDTCVNGECFNDPVECDDGDPCTNDVCVPVFGSGSNCCVPHAGTGCNDPACSATVCEVDSFCCTTAWDLTCANEAVELCGPCEDSAACENTPVDCDDQDPCTQDACEGGVCVYTPVNCDDGDACTNDSCDSMVGCVHTPVACDDDDACTVDTCVDGACVFAAVACDDDDPCTIDACIGGECVHTEKCPQNDPCSIHTCDPLTGDCIRTPLCDDGDACTEDTCDGGICSYTPIVCNDGDACTTDTCVGGECVYTPINCDDGDDCTIDGCVGGECIHGLIVCEDFDPCTVDTCVDGACQHTPLDCDDRDPCTIDDCRGGVCTHSEVLCDDGDACTTDQCVNGECVYTPINCDDRDPCTIDGCLEGECIHGLILCDDFDACTTDQCVNGECVYTPINCDDRDPCTIDGCLDGECIHGLILCDDFDACTTDECVEGACVHTPISCDDRDPCTTDACVDGQCVYTPLNCDDGDACTVDGCLLGECFHGLLVCEDFDPCTVDVCIDGACQHTPLDCDDRDPCTVDFCFFGQCVHLPPLCGDDDPCTVDSCVDGECVYTPIVCDDGDPCTDNVCVNGECFYPIFDVDLDGSSDCDDNCPTIFNPGQEDADNDGVGDACDGCADEDQDGVCDVDDICPGFPDQVDSDMDGVPDGCDECEGGDDFEDCNGNGIPDACDPELAFDSDWNGNGVPDICECLGDLNHDGTIDGGDLGLLLGNWDNPGLGDLNGDGWVDGADLGLLLRAWGDCLCADADRDGWCDAEDQCPGFDDNADADQDGIPDGCDGCRTATDCDDGDVCTVDTCVSGECVHTPLLCDDGDACTIDSCTIVLVLPSDCCVPHGGVGCSDPQCSALVCSIDAFCCNVAWDSICAAEAITECGPCATEPSLVAVCAHSPVSCDDGDGCTTDLCVNGECSHVPVLCDDQDPCTVDVCVEDGESFICIAEAIPGCDPCPFAPPSVTAECCATVCAADPFCCAVGWDAICANEATTLCGEEESDCCVSNGGVGCDDAACESAVCALDPFCCATAWDSVCASQAVGLCEVCGGGGGGSTCCTPQSLPGCDDAACAATVCAIDSFCCATAWDSICVSEAEDFCGDLCF